MVIWIHLLLIAVPLSDEPTALQRSIEQQRGGRQWIDLPTDPPKSAEDSQTCFQAEPGCRIELVAAEPLVLDPVWIDFDHRGRMFVVEYGDYPTGPADPAAPALSRIVMLTDRDQDGRMDQRNVFADELRFCHSLLPLYDGILTCTETQILFLKDSDGDGTADVREVWFDGFTPAHPQMQIGCPRRGMDNRIWLTYGPGNVRCLRPGFESVSAVRLPRADFCFDPVTMEFEAVTGLGQFGNTVNNEGRRFFSTNRNPIIMQVLPRSFFASGSVSGVSTGQTNVGPAGERTRVYPLVSMKSNWLSHAGTHTSACGVTAYRGPLFDETFRHSVFVCEPVGHLITRSITSPDGAALTARRAQPNADFLASTDTWFRPASLRTGPDGALYVADMYRLWVEHPKFVPPEVAAKMDWRAGDDRGRIWRIVPTEETRQPDSNDPKHRSDDAVTDVELVALLRSRNGQQRDLGQRLIVEQQRLDLIPMLRTVLSESQTEPYAALHALWALHGLDALTQEDLTSAVLSKPPFLRRDAVQLLTTRIQDRETLQPILQQALLDPTPEVRLQALLVSVDSRTSLSPAAIAAAMRQPDNDRWILAAALQATRGMELAVLQQLLSIPTDLSARHVTDIRQLTESAAASASPFDVTELVKASASRIETSPSVAVAMLNGLEAGLRSNKSSETKRSLNRWLSAPPPDASDEARQVAAFIDGIPDRLADPSRSLDDRLDDATLAALLPTSVLLHMADGVLASGCPSQLQLALLHQLQRRRDEGIPELMMQHWSVLHPSAQSDVLDWMLSRTATTAIMLQQMQANKVPPAAVTIDQRMRLLQHRDEDIRQTASKLFGGTVSPNRQKVADSYEAALTRTGVAAEGKQVFARTCARCHRLNGIGHQTGPDISDTRSRSHDALLYDILDPNRRVDPQYNEYTVVTTDGVILTGLLAAETPETIVLRQPESKTTTIQRTDIDELRATQKSLMPEGIEKDVTVQQMADLLAYLKSS